jgi:hypothetical protein
LHEPALEPESNAAKAPAGAWPGWTLTGPEEVAHVSEKPAIGYTITEIFNFRAQLHTQIAEKMNTGIHSQAISTFAQLGGDGKGGLIAEAAAALAALGGAKAPRAPGA